MKWSGCINLSNSMKPKGLLIRFDHLPELLHHFIAYYNFSKNGYLLLIYVMHLKQTISEFDSDHDNLYCMVTQKRNDSLMIQLCAISLELLFHDLRFLPSF